MPGTNVLQTEFTTPTGNSMVTDFMPAYSFGDGRYHAIHQIVRKVQCTEGQVELTVSFLPQPDYGRVTAKVAVHGREASCEWNDSRLLLTGPVRFFVTGGRADARLTLQAGGDAFFTLTYSDAGHPVVVSRLSQREQLDATIRHWQAEAGTLDYGGLWRNDVLRSYLALRLMTFQPTGGIVAAPTTSLPEEIGGVRNWDTTAIPGCGTPPSPLTPCSPWATRTRRSDSSNGSAGFARPTGTTSRSCTGWMEARTFQKKSWHTFRGTVATPAPLECTPKW